MHKKGLRKQYLSRKWQEYPKTEAKKIFDQTVKKMIASKTEALVCLREDNHDLIKSEMV